MGSLNQIRHGRCRQTPTDDQSMITQRMLKELRTLQGMQNLYTELREKILHLLDAGADVENGTFTLDDGEPDRDSQRRGGAATQGAGGTYRGHAPHCG